MSARRGRLRRPVSLTAPTQGFSALLAFLLLMAVVGVAVADARRTVGPGSHETEFIAWLMVLGGLVGYVVARSSLPLVSAHAIGAAIGTFVLLAALGAAITGTDLLSWPDPAEVGRRMAALWDDLVLLASPAPSGDGQRPWGFAMLVLGALCWTTAQFGAMSLFRHGRATPAVGAAGILLFVDVLVPSPYRAIDPVPIAVLFAGLSLFLLVRIHLAQQQIGWARRSVTEGRDVARVFLGAGALFIVAIVVGTTTLTTFAVAERGTIPWQSLAQPLESVREQLLRVLEGLGVRIPPDPPEASLFSRHQEIPDRWQMGDGTAFEATTGPDQSSPYWFGAAFETLTRDGYDFTDAREFPIVDGTLRYGELEIPSERPVEREQVTTVVDPMKDGHYTLLAPGTATGVSDVVQGSVLQHQGGGARIGVDLEPTSSVGSYEVTSLVLPIDVLASDPLSADVLRNQSTKNGPELRPYLQVPDSLIGPRTNAFIAKVRRQAGDDRYDVAKAVQDDLRGFAYETDMVGVCGDLPATECLLTVKKGFCSYYALTMAAVLRKMDIPTRIVHGYLPGEQGADGRWTVPLQAAHAWVEVWFDRAGWVRFDPTPQLEAFGGTPTALEDQDRGDPGSQDGAASPEPSASPEAPEPSPSPEPDVQDPAAGTTDGQGPELPMLALLIGGFLVGGLLVVGGIMLILVRRLPDGDPSLAYRGVVRLASRFGRGPTPAQTEYEYARSLGEALPSVSQELELVTRVHVEAVYGRRGATADALEGLRGAYARVRTATLRLLLRR